jgi:hypothetical protein
MRMPRYNMSATEATRLAHFFAALDDAEFPYEYQKLRQPVYLAEAEQRYQQVLRAASTPDRPLTGSRLDDAMKVVTDRTDGCVKCHLVGDFDPEASSRTKAPDLSLIYRRLRPERVRNWIASPKSLLPYTAMPVNVPYDPDLPNLGGMRQDLLHGTSVEQIEALVDLLMNYDAYAKQRSSVAAMVRQSAQGDETNEEEQDTDTGS